MVKRGALRKRALDGDVDLLCVGIAHVRRGEGDGAVGLPGRPAGLVRVNGKTGAPAEVGLVMLRLCVYRSFSDEEVGDHGGDVARIEQAITGAQHGLVVQRVRQADARREVLAGRGNVAGLRIVRIGDGRLRQDRVFVAHAVVGGQLRRDLPGVLGIECQVGDVGVDDGIAEDLGVAGVVAGAGRRDW